MKGIVVYYSATGNTKKVARAIYGGARDILKDCDITTVKEANLRDMAKYDLIIIGGPIWYYRETANLRLFIYNMPQLDGKLCVPFCVHGAAPFGFMGSVVPALKRKGLTIIGYNDWYGSVYQVTHMPKPYLTDGHPDEIDLKDAAEFGRDMAERAVKIAGGATALIPELPKRGRIGTLWGPPRPPRLPAMQKISGDPVKKPPMPLSKRKINLEKCLYPECTICSDNCPMNAIDFTVSPPVFKKSCVNGQYCCLCERICPTGAVEIDEETAKHRIRKIINMEKCTYPECTLCVEHCPMDAIDFSVDPPVFKSNCELDDLCWGLCPHGAIEFVNEENIHYNMDKVRENHPVIKMLNEASAKGHFRWLVSLDEIGWDNPIYRMRNNPRFNIKELLEDD